MGADGDRLGVAGVDAGRAGHGRVGERAEQRSQPAGADDRRAAEQHDVRAGAALDAEGERGGRAGALGRPHDLDVAAEELEDLLEARGGARSLHASVEVGRQVPEELYEAVAQLLAFVYRVAAARRASV